MDDDYDIYGDLDGFEADTRKENQVVKELNAEIEELKAKIEEKETEKEVITKQNGILLENISSLLLTAKAEIKRKDSLIADIRRQRDDAAFRRKPRTVRKHDKTTQTTLIRLLNQSAQTETVGTMTEKRLNDDRGRDRNRRRSRSVSRDRRRISEHSRNRDRSPRKDLREMLREKKNVQKALLIEKRRERRGMQFNVREKEREIDKRARHRENRSPDLSPVEFPCLRRRSREEVVKADSVAETKLEEVFIPMNKKELDRYVKEMARSDKRSPDTLEAVSNSDLWDAQKKPPKRKESRENRSSKDEHIESNDHATTTVETASNYDPRLETKTAETKRRTSKLAMEDHIIQSDEIGTTGVGASLSPEKMEDVEQTMRALHGDSTPSCNVPQESIQTSTELIEGLNKSFGALDTSQPPALVIPPREPPIIELVPELSFEDDQRLNDSRELRIVESEDTAAEQEDERNSSAETVIAKQQVGNKEEKEQDLEEGEVVSSDESQPAPGVWGKPNPAIPVRLKASTSVPNLKLSSLPKSQKTPTRARDGRARISLDKLSDSVVRRHAARSSQHHRLSSDSSNSSRHATKPNQAKSDRHFETSTPSRTTRRKSQRLGDRCVVKEKPKSPVATIPVRVEPDVVKKEAHGGKSKKEELKELFGTDDENSLFGTPDKVSAKRRHSGKRDKSEDRKKQKVDGSEVRVADEERVFKEIASSKRRSKSGTRDKTGVAAGSSPRKEVCSSGLKEPMVMDSLKETITPIQKNAAGLTEIEKHHNSESEAVAKTLSEVINTSSRSENRAIPKSPLRHVIAGDERPSTDGDVLEIVRPKRRSKSKTRDKTNVSGEISSKKEIPTTVFNEPIVVDSSSEEASTQIHKDTAKQTRVEQHDVSGPEAAEKTVPEVSEAAPRSRTASKGSLKHFIADDERPSIDGDVLEIVRPKRRSKSKTSDKINTSGEISSKKGVQTTVFNEPIVVDSSSEEASTQAHKNTARQTRVEKHEATEPEAPQKTVPEVNKAAPRSRTASKGSLKHFNADEERPSTEADVLEIFRTKRRSKSKTRDKISVPAKSSPGKEVCTSGLNVPMVVDSSSEEASTPIDKNTAGLELIETHAASEPVKETLPEVTYTSSGGEDRTTSKSSLKHIVADEERPSIEDDVLEIVRTKRRKSKARVSGEISSKQELKNPAFNEPITVDSSSEDGPTSSEQIVRSHHENIITATQVETLSTSKPEATAETHPQVNDTNSGSKVCQRATSKSSLPEIIVNDEEPPMDLSVQSQTATCKIDELPEPVTEGVETECSSVPAFSDASLQHATDVKTLADQPSLQCPPSMEVSSSSTQQQSDDQVAFVDLSAEAEETDGATFAVQPKEPSQEDQKDKNHSESLTQREMPQLLEASEDLSSIGIEEIEIATTEGPATEEALLLESPQQPDTQTFEDQPVVLSQRHTSSLTSSIQNLSERQNVLPEGSLEVENDITAEVAEEIWDDLPNQSSQIDHQESSASPDQQTLNVPSSEATECTDAPAYQPAESVLVSPPNLPPETPQTDPHPEIAASSKPSESPKLPKTPQVIIYSDKYAEYRVEDNSEAEITIYVTRKKRRSRKLNQTNGNLCTSDIVVE